MTIMSSTRRSSRGFTIIELLVALGIGSLMATAMLMLFARTLESNREQFKAVQQIESGRYALDVLFNDIRHAGFFGDYSESIAAPSSLPDPCSIPAEGAVVSGSANADHFALHIQGYPASDLNTAATIPAACASWIDSTTLRPGSDIVVVRRLNTVPLVPDPPAADTDGTGTTATVTANDLYAQTDTSNMDVQYGVAATINATKTAKNAPTTLQRRHPSIMTSPRPLVAAAIRKMHVHIYFVASCRQGSGSNGKCLTTDDTVPTLKRLELVAGASAPTFQLVPLADGIEFLKLRYGLDTTSTVSGKKVDAVEDSIVTAPATVADWQNAVTAEINVLARNPDSTSDYTDTKTYDLGSATFTPSGAAVHYKRHVFRSKVFIANVGGRREW
jgi:type IV pilus assembly protein PilW